MKNRLFIFGLCFATACQPIVNSRGNTTVKENFGDLIVGKTTVGDVIEKCGTPSLRKDEYAWIYAGDKIEESSFGKPKSIDRFVVKMTFDQNKILRSIEKIAQKENGEFMDEEITNLISNRLAKAKTDEALRRKSN